MSTIGLFNIYGLDYKVCYDESRREVTVFKNNKLCFYCPNTTLDWLIEIHWYHGCYNDYDLYCIYDNDCPTRNLFALSFDGDIGLWVFDDNQNENQVATIDKDLFNRCIETYQQMTHQKF